MNSGDEGTNHTNEVFCYAKRVSGKRQCLLNSRIC